MYNKSRWLHFTLLRWIRNFEFGIIQVGSWWPPMVVLELQEDDLQVPGMRVNVLDTNQIEKTSISYPESILISNESYSEGLSIGSYEWVWPVNCEHTNITSNILQTPLFLAGNSITSFVSITSEENEYQRFSQQLLNQTKTYAKL